MPAQWTGELIGQMHLKGVTIRQLAEELGVSVPYVSMVLNGHRSPPDAEKRFFSAFGKVVKKNTT